MRGRFVPGVVFDEVLRGVVLVARGVAPTPDFLLLVCFVRAIVVVVSGGCRMGGEVAEAAGVRKIAGQQIQTAEIVDVLQGALELKTTETCGSKLSSRIEAIGSRNKIEFCGGVVGGVVVWDGLRVHCSELITDATYLYW